jgi:hypothetical protein
MVQMFGAASSGGMHATFFHGGESCRNENNLILSWSLEI